MADSGFTGEDPGRGEREENLHSRLQQLKEIALHNSRRYESFTDYVNTLKDVLSQLEAGYPMENNLQDKIQKIKNSLRDSNTWQNNFTQEKKYGEQIIQGLTKKLDKGRPVKHIILSAIKIDLSNAKTNINKLSNDLTEAENKTKYVLRIFLNNWKEIKGIPYGAKGTDEEQSNDYDNKHKQLDQTKSAEYLMAQMLEMAEEIKKLKISTPTQPESSNLQGGDTILEKKACDDDDDDDYESCDSGDDNYENADENDDDDSVAQDFIYKQSANEAREKAEREKAEKIAKEAREKADREKADREKAENIAKEAREKAEREKAEKIAKEAREKAEKIAKEAREKADREKAEKIAKEAKEKAEREKAEKIAKEAREKAEKDLAEVEASNTFKKTMLQKYTYTYEEKNGFDIRAFKFAEEYIRETNPIRRILIGEPNYKPTKTMLLVGGTGAGKSSLVSTLVNIAFGIEYTSKFRLKIAKEFQEIKPEKSNDPTASQTEWISVYQFNHMPGMSIDYNLTIIDTPGLNDTRGLEYDMLFLNRLEILLKGGKEFGVDEVNCIGIVVPENSIRLTNSQKYIYDGCMRMFGNDVENIIHVMATFSDYNESRIPDVLKTAQIEYKEFHQFNSSAIYLRNDEENKKLALKNELSWDYIAESCEEFYKILKKTTGNSLTNTIQTLENRNKLHVIIEEAEKKLLADLDNVQKLQMSQNPFEPRLRECTKMVLNCTKCHVTCHRPCNFFCQNCKDLKQKVKKCRCGCLLDSHLRENLCYDAEDDVKRKNNMKELISSLSELKICTDKLNEVALRPIPKTNEKYLDDLIEGESDKGKKAILFSIKLEESLLGNENKVEKLKRQYELNNDVEKGENRCPLM